MKQDYQKFGLYSDEDMQRLCTEIDVTIVAEEPFPNLQHRLYFGSPYKYNFMYGQEDKDIILTYGTQAFNLGKYVESCSLIPIDITIEDGVEDLCISPTYVEWLPEDSSLDTQIAWCALITNHQLRLDFVKEL